MPRIEDIKHGNGPYGPSCPCQPRWRYLGSKWDSALGMVQGLQPNVDPTLMGITIFTQAITRLILFNVRVTCSHFQHDEVRTAPPSFLSLSLSIKYPQNSVGYQSRIQSWSHWPSHTVIRVGFKSFASWTRREYSQITQGSSYSAVHACFTFPQMFIY